MSDRATIEIDCDRGCVTVNNNDLMETITIGRQMETTKASIIVQLLAPRIRELMVMSKPQLMGLHIDQILKVER